MALRPHSLRRWSEAIRGIVTPSQGLKLLRRLVLPLSVLPILHDVDAYVHVHPPYTPMNDDDGDDGGLDDEIVLNERQAQTE
jgi:hypothetical protein